jgi:hypothetical protein
MEVFHSLTKHQNNSYKQAVDLTSLLIKII